jgi:hypothetical protein
MNFLDAKKIISPDTSVVPGSKEHQDILNLMRESGRVFPEDNVPVVPIPLVRPPIGIERAYVSIEPKPVKKKPGLWVGKKDARTVPAVRPYYFVAGGKSKLECKKFKIPSVIIEDGTDERGAEVQTTCETEGGTGENEGGS